MSSPESFRLIYSNGVLTDASLNFCGPCYPWLLSFSLGLVGRLWYFLQSYSFLQLGYSPHTAVKSSEFFF